MALFGKKEPPVPRPVEQLSEELKNLLQQAQDERSKVTSLLGRTSDSVEKLEKLATPLRAVADKVEEISARLGRVEENSKQLDALSQRLEQLGQRAASIEQGQGTVESRLTRANAEVGDVLAVAEGLKESVQQAVQVRAELQGAVGTGGPVDDMRRRMEELRERFLSYGHDVAQNREAQDALRRAQDEAIERINRLRGEADRIQDRLVSGEQQVAKVSVALGNLTKVQELAPRAEQDVQALNALADHVAHKTRILEKQREVADRAAAQLARLDDQVWNLEAQAKKFQMDARNIQKTQEKLEDLQELVTRVETRTTEVRASQQAAEKEGASNLSRLTGIRDEIRSSLERFNVEKQGMDAVNQRVTDVRGALTEFERRFSELQGTGQGIAQAQARADDLSARLTTMAADIQRVSEQGERARNIEVVLDRTDGVATRLAGQIASLQASSPDMVQLQRDVGELKSVRETVLDASERVRAAHAELERGMAGHTEARAQVTAIEEMVAGLRQRMAEVEARSAAVEHVGRSAESALAAQKNLESRREFLDQLERRVAQLGALSGDLEQRARVLEDRRSTFGDLESRTEGLRGRLDDADRRFESVAARVTEATQLDARISAVVGRAQSAEERMNALGKGLDDAGQREVRLNELSGRIERTGRDLEQRERTIQQAVENLDRATTARQAAMEAAQALEEQGRRFSVSMAGAEAQAERMAQLMDQLEARAGGLRLADKRLTAFEEKLVQLQRSEQQLERSMDGLAGRAKSVDAVRDELSRVFELVENTMQDVRAISVARQDVQGTRASLDEVLQRAGRVDQMVAGIDRRHREIELAEQRIARLDALMVDIRSGLEAVQVQKATIDHVLEKATQLTFLAKEAEALITTLREEREITGRVHDGLKELRDEERQSRAG